MRRNLRPIEERGWFDVPIVLDDGKRAIVAFEKGRTVSARSGVSWGSRSLEVLKHSVMPFRPFVSSHPPAGCETWALRSGPDHNCLVSVLTHGIAGVENKCQYIATPGRLANPVS